MIQFYCLSILLNFFVGLMLAFNSEPEKNKDDYFSTDFSTEFDDDDSSSEEDDKPQTLFGENSFANDQTFRLVLGVFSAFVGFLKMMPQISGGIVVVGDFFPSLAGFLGGICFILEYITESGIIESFPSVIETIFFTNRRYIGFFCLFAALLHFILPQIIIL